MKKIITNGILSLSIFLTAPDSVFSSDRESGRLAKIQSSFRDCLKHCNEYYRKHDNLQGFQHFEDGAGRTVGNALGNNLVARLVTEVVNSATKKDAACSRLRGALNDEYKNSSKLYNACKRGMRCVIGALTNDPNLRDIFSSCKDTCAVDIDRACK